MTTSTAPNLFSSLYTCNCKSNHHTITAPRRPLTCSRLYIYVAVNLRAVIVWCLDLQLHVYKDENKLGGVEVVIVWWLDLPLHIYKDENKLGAVEGCDRMVVGFTTTCI
jgi:hypothetical protein